MGIPPGGLHQVSALCCLKWLRKSIRCQITHTHTHTYIQDFSKALCYGIIVRCDLATQVAADKKIWYKVGKENENGKGIKLALKMRGREKIGEKRWYKEGKENKNVKGKTGFKDEG